MKKYLITGLAAVAISGMFTSCTHDTDAGGSGNLGVVETYEQAFISRFGTPSPDADWGFGPSTTQASTRALGDYDDYKGTMQPVESYQDPNDGWKWKTRPLPFPSDCDASNFDPDLTGVKSYKEIADAANQGGGFATGICYIDENHTGKIHIWGGSTRAKLYFKAGTYDFTNETFDLCENADLYLLSGATVTLNNTAANTAKFDVYIAPGAKLIANGENGYRADVDAHVYNHGTIECTRFEVNGTGSLYNVGALKVPSGDVYIANSTSRIVNDGTINAASTHVEGSGALQNNAEWTVTGNTVVNCNVGGWVNNGHWTTQNYHYTAGSNNVINNCFLKVTNEFNINMSSASAENGFKIDSNGGVETKTFNGGKAGDNPNSKSGPYKVIMGHKSLFKVTGTATLEGGNKGWGFFGPADGEYAVFQAKDVVRAAGLEKTQGAVTYGGNLYVSAETHFAQGHDGQDADGHYFISEEGGFSVNTNIYAAGFKGGKPSITIKKTPCNPGFGGSEQSEDVVRVIAEDMGDQATNESSDFDFNDVVFDVEYVSASEAKVTILAAGGTLPLTVGWDGDEKNESGYIKYEVHNLLGYSETMIINTNSKVGNHIDNVEPKTITVSGSFDKDNLAVGANAIPVKVRKNNKWYTIEAKKGRAAGKLCVGTDYEWCNERQDIYNKWSDENGALFLQYVNDPNTLTKYWYRKSSNYKK